MSMGFLLAKGYDFPKKDIFFEMSLFFHSSS